MMTLYRLTFGIILCVAVLGFTVSTSLDLNDPDEARKALEEQRILALEEVQETPDTEAINRLIELGLWDEAEQWLDKRKDYSNAVQLKLAEADLLLKKHRYQEAQEVVEDIFEMHPKNREAKLLQAELYTQAWQLTEADQIAKELLNENSKDPKAGIIRGNIALLQRDYDGAMEWAKKVQSWDSDFAKGYVLESEVHFWLQQPDQAEAALVKALERSPFNSDARYYYGYAIWRGGDATQLDEMAAQWNLALEINPQHYLTHWHFGNGHTNLTYADYVHPTDSTVKDELSKSDELVEKGNVAEAIDVTRRVEMKYPESVLPAMTRGSMFYIAYDMDREARLDSAEAAFTSVLEKKKNYGPAHNGLAAVIKQRQFMQLDSFETLEDTIAQTSVPPSPSVFYNVFPDAEYYPGDRVTKMIAQQIGPSKAYLPMINAFDDDFVIPPLHIDLAEAMDNNYFRYGTTFDNRQWMDIRGVGSGATGIEYLERGAHLERNVLAHEYAHLYHGRILTDHEDRRIRALYHEAMKNDRTLDYYAANNESEFFAQGYAGFLSEEKVHPLNHKSMNTREYIRKKDPDFYSFLDSLLTKQQEYLDGNEEVFDDNWAQTYLALSKRSSDTAKAKAYLDTSLTHSADYVPALLEYAEWEAREGNFDRAYHRIDDARALNQDYAPLYMSEAEIIHQQASKSDKLFNDAIAEMDSLFQKVSRLETDLAERAELNGIQRERFYRYGKLDKAMHTAEVYADSAEAISTYLEDRKEEAEAFYHKVRSSIGYSDEAAGYFEALVEQNPQNFQYRLMYIDVLIEADRGKKADSVLTEGQRILESADNERDDYTLRAAQVYALRGEHQKAKQTAEEIDFTELETEEVLMGSQLWVVLNDPNKAMEIAEMADVVFPFDQAELTYSKGLVALKKENLTEAENAFQEVLSTTPFHLQARVKLVYVLQKLGKSDQALKVTAQADSLTIPLGPDFKEGIELQEH